MRRSLLFLMTSLGLVAPALGANPMTDPQSPELRQCIAQCGKTKDTAAREACDIKCTKEDETRRQHNTSTPTDQGRKPRH